MSINRPAALIIRAAALLGAAVLVVPAWRHWNETPPPAPPPLRLALPTVDDLTIGGGPDHPFGLALAPDGRRIAFPASRGAAAQLWIRQVTTGEVVPLTGTEGAVMPFWSADATRIGFFADGRLRVLTLDGGQVADLAAAPAPRGGVFHPDGRVVFAPDNNGLMEWRPDSSELRSITKVDATKGETAHRFPVLARRPGDEPRWEIVYLVQASEATRAGLWTVSGSRLTQSETSALVADDWLLYARGGALFAQRIEWREESAYQPALTGKAQLIGTPVGRSPLAQLFASATNEAIIFDAPQPQLRELRWIERREATQATLASEVDAWDLRIAPQGGRVVVTQKDPQLGTLDIWAYEGNRLLPRRISQAIDVDEHAVWSPDATRVAWIQARRTIAFRGARAELPEQYLRQFDTPARLWDWSPDGQSFIVGQNRPGTKEDLFIVSAGTGGALGPAKGSATPSNGAFAPSSPPPPPPETVYAHSTFNETHADISPDGRWIAYASDESGQAEVYIDSFPAPGQRARVTTGGGTEPRWGAGMREVFFRRGREIHVASLAFFGAALEATGTARLVDAGGDIRAYDVTPDGQRFLVNVPAPSNKPSPIAFVVHWRSLLQ